MLRTSGRITSRSNEALSTVSLGLGAPRRRTSRRLPTLRTLLTFPQARTSSQKYQNARLLAIEARHRRILHNDAGSDGSIQEPSGDEAVATAIGPIERRWEGNPYMRIMASPLRRCVITQKVLPRDLMIHLKPVFLPSSSEKPSKQNMPSQQQSALPQAILPDAILHPRYAARKPGRGLWFTANRDVFEELQRRQAHRRFAPAATLPARLGEMIGYQLRQRVLQEAQLMSERVACRPLKAGLPLRKPSAEENSDATDVQKSLREEWVVRRLRRNWWHDPSSTVDGQGRPEIVALLDFGSTPLHRAASASEVENLSGSKSDSDDSQNPTDISSSKGVEGPPKHTLSPKMAHSDLALPLSLYASTQIDAELKTNPAQVRVAMVPHYSMAHLFEPEEIRELRSALRSTARVVNLKIIRACRRVSGSHDQSGPDTPAPAQRDAPNTVDKDANRNCYPNANANDGIEESGSTPWGAQSYALRQDPDSVGLAIALWRLRLWTRQNEVDDEDVES